MKRFLASLLLVFVSVAVVVVLFEGYVRLAETNGENFDIEMWRYARDMKRVSSIPDMGHEHVPGRSGTYMGVDVEINSVGWRDREYDLDKPDGVVRIMMLGDSLTFGWGAPPQDVTAFVLEDLLNQGGTQPYEVLNTGIGNTNTAMQAAYFINEGHKYEPDIVVLNYFINDAEPTPSRNQNWLIENSYAAVFLAGRLDILMRIYFGRGDWRDHYDTLYERDQPGWRNARRALASLAAFCRERDIELVVVNYPELHQLSPYPFEDVSARVRAEAEVHGLPFLDLLPAIADQTATDFWVTETDAHPNGRAARAYARTILDFLRSQHRDSGSTPFDDAISGPDADPKTEPRSSSDNG